MTAGDSAEKALLVSPDAAADDLGRAVRLFCTVERHMTIGQLAAAAGMAEKRLRRLIDNQPEERRPIHLAEALALWAVMGTRAASLSLARIGMVAEPEEAEPESLTRAAAELAMASGELAMICVDGIDPDEADPADAKADKIIAIGVRMKAAAAKAKRKGRRT